MPLVYSFFNSPSFFPKRIIMSICIYVSLFLKNGEHRIAFDANRFAVKTYGGTHHLSGCAGYCSACTTTSREIARN